VFFDTEAGDRIEMKHLLASCGFLPDFAPVEIGGRLLGDGGLSLNAPIEIVLAARGRPGAPIFIVDLFAVDGERPRTLEAALERKNDLLFGNQTRRRLDAHLQSNAKSGPFICLSYRSAADEAGPEKMFDFSLKSVDDRWNAGSLDMADALQSLAANGLPNDLLVVRRDRQQRIPGEERAA
jgi:NTE family protein